MLIKELDFIWLYLSGGVSILRDLVGVLVDR